MPVLPILAVIPCQQKFFIQFFTAQHVAQHSSLVKLGDFLDGPPGGRPLPEASPTNQAQREAPKIV